MNIDLIMSAIESVETEKGFEILPRSHTLIDDALLIMLCKQPPSWHFVIVR